MKFIKYTAPNLLIALAGCATTDNPREGGFFDALAGVNSGAYEKRIQQRKEILSNKQGEGNELKKESVSLTQESKNKNDELAVERKRMADMEITLSTLQNNVSVLKGKSAKQQKEISNLQIKISKLRTRIKAEQVEQEKFEREGGQERYRVLELEKKKLADEYNNLIEYSKSLTEATK